MGKLYDSYSPILTLTEARVPGEKYGNGTYTFKMKSYTAVSIVSPSVTDTVNNPVWAKSVGEKINSFPF
jgi:hypothetical protein